MANLAALRVAVFFAICEKPEGGGADNRPPALRGLMALGIAGVVICTPEVNGPTTSRMPVMLDVAATKHSHLGAVPSPIME